MITLYHIRDNIDNGHIYGEPTGWSIEHFSRLSAGFDSLKKAKTRLKAILERNPNLIEKLYITETEYADERRAEQDFHIQSYIRWAGWLGDYDGD